MTLILSPHYDDAPLSLGAALLAGVFGENPEVAIVFSRSKYTKDLPGTGDVEIVSATRAAEERQAAEKMGYRVSFLGFGETYARKGYIKWQHIYDLRREQDDEIWPGVLSTLERLAEHEDLILAPLGCGDHIDHRIVREALIHCVRRKPDLRVGFYEDLPYCEELSDSAIMEKVSALGALNLRPMITSVGIEAKMAVLGCYQSQFDPEDLDPVRRYWLRRGGERMWVSDIGPRR